MGGLRVFLAALCLGGPIWLAASVPAHACSCGSLAASAHEVDLIVVGTVSGVRLVAEPPGLSATPEPGVTPIPEIAAAVVAWDFAVDEYIKGSGPSQLELHSNGHASLAGDGSVTISPGLGPDCSFAPEDGSRYLFGVTRSNGENLAGGCGSAQITEESESHVNDLIAEIRAILAGPDAFPDTGAGPPSEGSSFPTLAAAGIGATLAAALLLTPLALRTRRER